MDGRRRIIVEVATSADGMIARQDGSVDWLEDARFTADYGMAAFYASIDTILWGRKTYETALDFQRKGVSGAGFDTKVKNYVFTRGAVPDEVPEGVAFVTEPIKAFAARLRSDPGKDIWMMGGGSLIASFLEAGEIDRFMVQMMPVYVGLGIPLVGALERDVRLELISCTKFEDGVVGLQYDVRR